MSMFMRGDKTSDNPAAEAKVPQGAAPASREEARRAERPRQDAVPSLISAGLTVKGNLESAGEIQIDGDVEGDVRGKTVVVGQGAIVKGSVLGDAVTVAGSVEGRVEAMTVNVQKTARLTGDIIHQTLQIDSGAYVDGHCRPHYGKAEARPAGPKPVPPTAMPERKGGEKIEGAAGKVN
jgi:cytoskeletal protein CcmA (bactofilin family)